MTAVCLAAPPQTVSAQQSTKVWHIGLCHVGLDHEPPGLHELHQALNNMGYKDGKNLNFDWRNQKDASTAKVAINEWVAGNVDLIVGFEDQCVRAARAATSKIPIVFVQIYDPQRGGYIKSLARPGGNLTGPVSNLGVIGKRLELLKEIDPRLSDVLVLFDGNDPYAPGELALARQAAATLHVNLVERDTRTTADLEHLFAGLKPGEVGAVIVASPDLQTNHPQLIIKLGNAARLPVAGHREAWVEWGALFSYSADTPAAGPVAARYIDKIFKGANPSELPVEELSTMILTLNQKRARELGLTIPPAVRTRADRVLE
jgi:putative tryptophan/tyrosine transport system substrate-binding protein